MLEVKKVQTKSTLSVPSKIIARATLRLFNSKNIRRKKRVHDILQSKFLEMQKNLKLKDSR